MHIWLINQTPQPHKLPTVWHPRPLTHADTLPEAGKRRQLLSWFAVYWGGGRCPRGMGRLPVCHINNSQVGWSGVINMASHCRPSEPRNPGVMAAAGAWFPEGQLRKRRWLWGTSALISPLRLEPAASHPGIHFNLCIYRERQDRDLIILSERAERLVFILAYRWTHPLFLYFRINWFFNNYTSYLCPCICLYYDLIFGTCVWWDSLSLFSCPWNYHEKTINDDNVVPSFVNYLYISRFCIFSHIMCKSAPVFWVLRVWKCDPERKRTLQFNSTGRKIF